MLIVTFSNQSKSLSLANFQTQKERQDEGKIIIYIKI